MARPPPWHTELRPAGMTGGGLVDFTNATLASELFDFKTMQLHADTSDFRLTAGDTASIAFKTDNVNATVKLDERVGEFVSNGDETIVEFPVNQYICYMDRFVRYMDQNDIELESDRTAAAGSEDLQLSGSNFISVRADGTRCASWAQGPLRPETPPDHRQRGAVHPGGRCPGDAGQHARAHPPERQHGPFTNATITANDATKYHTIVNATVNIAARRQYSGTGEIDYVDENKKAFRIRLQNVNVDTAYQTYARGGMRRTSSSS